MIRALFLLLPFALAACCAQRPAVQVRTETRTDTLWRRHEVHVPGALVRDTLRDTLRLPGQVVVRQDTTGRATLRYWRDAYGRLVAQCEARAETLHIPVPYVRQAETQYITVERPVTPGWMRTTLYVVAATCVVLFLILILKR